MKNIATLNELFYTKDDHLEKMANVRAVIQAI